jgi:hypothetical protein
MAHIGTTVLKGCTILLGANALLAIACSVPNVDALHAEAAPPAELSGEPGEQIVANDGSTEVADAGSDVDAGPPKPALPPTKKLAVLTGTKTSSGKFGVGGTDLGVPVRQPDGKIAFIFGDTFDHDGTGGSGWRAPVLLRSDPDDYKSGITFTSAAGGQYAKQILAYPHTNRTTYLPSDVITIGKRMYLHYMVNEPFGNVTSTAIAYSDDNGENWVQSKATWSGGANNGLRQLWTWARGDDGFVYVLSTKFDRKNPIILHRVPEGEVLDPSAYEPWGYKAGAWAWGNPATPVLGGKFGEMCLRRIENKWVLSYFNAKDYNITILVFDTPTSNLYQATKFVPISGGAWGAETDSSVAQLYGGYIHPKSTLHEMYLIVSQWNTGTNQDYHAMEFFTAVADD